MARGAQDASGLRIRISRKVKNQLDFSSELEVWHSPVQTGIAQRKSLGSLALTIFDTTQQPLQSMHDYTQESLEDMLQCRLPSLFEESPPIAVTGSALFGSRLRPFIALTLAAGHAHSEQAAVRSLVAPELSLDSRHQLDHQPHISLGQVFAPNQAEPIRSLLTPVLPGYVQLSPARIIVEQRS
jgi:hypothetical protein